MSYYYVDRCPICGKELSEDNSTTRKEHEFLDHEIHYPKHTVKWREYKSLVCIECNKKLKRNSVIVRLTAIFVIPIILYGLMKLFDYLAVLSHFGLFNILVGLIGLIGIFWLLFVFTCFISPVDIAWTITGKILKPIIGEWRIPYDKAVDVY